MVRQLLMDPSNFSPLQAELPSGKKKRKGRLSLLLYHFCNLLVVFLNAPTITQGVVAPEATCTVKLLLELVDESWLVDGHGLFAQSLEDKEMYMKKYVLVRMLWMAGLVLDRKTSPERTYSFLFLRFELPDTNLLSLQV